MQILIISIAALITTLLGGMFALRFKDKLHLILGFSAGAVIGVAFFDLIPEALNLSFMKYDAQFILSIVALGFLIYMIFDRLILFHAHHDDECSNEHHNHHSHRRGILGAGSLSLHSFLDGAAIGLAFKVSASVGLIVAVAVLVHDFSDGINTVNLILKNGGERRRAFTWLIVDAIAPVLGVISTFFFVLPSYTLGILLALFSGFFLYIGASDLLPESRHSHSMKETTFMTILGVVVLYVAIKLAGI
jgi:zinc transporter ZupT